MSTATYRFFLERNRVAACLRKSLGAFPLVALSAPPGYGKTIAAEQLAFSWPAPAVLTRIPSGCPDAPTLWQAFVTPLEAQYPALAAGLANIPPGNDPQTLASAVADALARLFGDTGCLWVVDDAHNLGPATDYALPPRTLRADPIDAAFFHGFFRALGAHGNLSSKLRVLVLSRSRLSSRFNELQLARLALAHDQRLLAFTREEALEYAFHTNFANEERTAGIWARTEGWPGAFCLLLHEGAGNEEAAPVAFDIHTFVEETVFSHLSPEQGRMLVRLSAMRRFSDQQAARLADNAEAPILLQQLFEANAFITRDDEGYFAFHPVFHTFLHSRFGLLEQAEKRTLYRRAAEEYCATGDYCAAIKAWVAAGERRDTTRLLAALAHETPLELLKDDLPHIQTLVEALPWKQRLSEPVGYLILVAASMLYGSMEQGRAMLDEAERRLRAGKWGKDTGMRLECELEACRGLARFNHLPAMLRHMRLSEEQHPRPSTIAAKFRYTLGSPQLGFLFHTTPGSLANNLRALNAGRVALPPAAPGLAELAQAELLLEPLKNEDTMLQAEIAATAARQEARAAGEDEVAVAATFTLARLEMLRGNGAAALRHADSAFHLLRERPPLSPCGTQPSGQQSLTASLCRDYIHLCLGRETAGTLSSQEATAGRPQLPGRNMGHLVHGKNLLAQRHWAGMLAALPAMRASLAPSSPVFGMMHTHIMEAVALFHLKGAKAGLGALDKALNLALADELAASMAEYGPSLFPLLDEALARHSANAEKNDRAHRQTTFIRHVKLCIARFAGAATLGEEAAPLLPSLTSREKLLLEMLAGRKNNVQIASAFSLNPEALKKALNRLYRKIGAENRKHAAELHARQEFGPAKDAADPDTDGGLP